MADRKNGTEEVARNAIGEEHGPGISSPVDCWELVSSPLPEAGIGGTALEAAIAAGFSPGDTLHDDYFTCPCNLFAHNDLPLSTMMADQQSEQGVHSSDRSDAHVSVGDEAEAIANREMMEHDDILPAGYDIDNNDSTSSEEDIIQAHTSISVVEFTGTSSNGHQLSTLAATQDSVLSSMSHGMQDNLMEIHPASTEGGNSPIALGSVSREHSGQVEDSLNLRGSLASTRNCKAFTCASWFWTQFCRWQAQLGYANTIWSMTLAAAVMGIIVLGRGWQRLQAQNYSLRSQLWAKEKRITQLMFQLLQTKEALAKPKRVPVICEKLALQISQG